MSNSTKRRDARRLAMQVLYQIDATGDADADTIAAGLDERDAEAMRHEAVELAVAAWAERDTIDPQITAVTPDWPTHRQPPVDRAILRLAIHEMTSGRTPPRVVINEAVELAKKFSNENAPSFINGVLDKLHKTLDLPPDAKAGNAAAPAKPVSADEWLDDATRDE